MCGNSKLNITAQETLEVVVDDATKVEFTFPQNVSTVEAGKIVALATHTVGEIPLSPSGKAIVNNTAFNKAYLVLRNRRSGRDDLNKIPLRDLLRSANNGEWIHLDGEQYDFSQSRIVVPNNAGLTANEVFMINVIYIPKDRICATK